MGQPRRKTADEGRRPAPGPVLRLRVQWSRGAWQVIKRLRIPAKTLPGQDEKMRPGERTDGFVVEALDSRGDVVYRRPLVNPFRGRAELFEPKGRPRAVEHLPDTVLFDVLVPDRDDVQTIRLVANPHPFHPLPGAKATGPVELARFDAREKPADGGKDQQHG